MGKGKIQWLEQSALELQFKLLEVLQKLRREEMKWYSQLQPAGIDEVDNHLATPGCMDERQYSGGD